MLNNKNNDEDKKLIKLVQTRLKHTNFKETIPFEDILKKYNITEDDLKNYDDIEFE